ncbi:ABC transporter ATP-binding protein, partial [Spirochaetota bacterium]
MAVVTLESVHKSYKDVKAVNDVSFTVDRGEVFGLIGANGAGKTTLIEMIEGIRRPDSGKILCLKHNPYENTLLKEKIGVQFQDDIIFRKVKVKELIKFYCKFYPNGNNPDDLLKLFMLENKQSSYYEDLSGGQRQRLRFAISMANNPDILFLDEPTAGVDPHSRRNIWNIIKDLNKNGKTIFLTTHYMEEVENLCDRVAIIDKGFIVEIDKPIKLVEKYSQGIIVNISFEKPVTKNI